MEENGATDFPVQGHGVAGVEPGIASHSENVKNRREVAPLHYNEKISICQFWGILAWGIMEGTAWEGTADVKVSFFGAGRPQRIHYLPASF
jgi:hypothetical protein